MAKIEQHPAWTKAGYVATGTERSTSLRKIRDGLKQPSWKTAGSHSNVEMHIHFRFLKEVHRSGVVVPEDAPIVLPNNDAAMFEEWRRLGEISDEESESTLVAEWKDHVQGRASAMDVEQGLKMQKHDEGSQMEMDDGRALASQTKEALDQSETCKMEVEEGSGSLWQTEEALDQPEGVSPSPHCMEEALKQPTEQPNDNDLQHEASSSNCTGEALEQPNSQELQPTCEASTSSHCREEALEQPKPENEEQPRKDQASETGNSETAARPVLSCKVPGFEVINAPPPARRPKSPNSKRPRGRRGGKNLEYWSAVYSR